MTRRPSEHQNPGRMNIKLRGRMSIRLYEHQILTKSSSHALAMPSPKLPPTPPPIFKWPAIPLALLFKIQRKDSSDASATPSSNPPIMTSPDSPAMPLLKLDSSVHQPFGQPLDQPQQLASPIEAELPVHQPLDQLFDHPQHSPPNTESIDQSNRPDQISCEVKNGLEVITYNSANFVRPDAVLETRTPVAIMNFLRAFTIWCSSWCIKLTPVLSLLQVHPLD